MSTEDTPAPATAEAATPAPAPATPPSDAPSTPPQPAPPTSPDQVVDAPAWASFQSVELQDWAAAEGLMTAEEIADRAAEFDFLADTDPAAIAVLPDVKDENAVTEFLRTRLTVPEDPAGYQLETIEGAEPEVAAQAATWFAEAGVADWQGRIIAEAQISFMQAEAKQLANEDREIAQLEAAALRKEWGREYYEKNELSRRVIRTALDAAGIDHSATLKFLSEGEGFAAVAKLAAMFGGRMDVSKLLPDVDPDAAGEQQPSRVDPAAAMAARMYQDI